MSDIESTEKHLSELNKIFYELLNRIKAIQIGTPEQFPFGWRKAAKGRTVWRIIEETISQNLEKYFNELGLSTVMPSESEVSVYDAILILKGESNGIYINIKSSVFGGKTQKDDISKAIGIRGFFEEDITRELFIATFVLRFDDKMLVHLENCYVMPITWIPDIYVNPSNNANLQSSKYKDINQAKKRSNQEFLLELTQQMEIAARKREAKMRRRRN